jgi:hypothetical protein
VTCGQPPGSTGAQGNCAGLFNAFLTQGYFTAGKLLGAAGLAVLGLIGMFWGAPLVARELETGTFRLAWTQGVTRTRWLAAKLAIAGAAAMAAGELFTLMVAWWSSPIHKANAGYTAFTSDSFHSGVAPAGYAAFAFALGVTAGLLIRRTLPAMAVTLAIFTAVIVAFPIWVRPHLIPPTRTTSALSLTSLAVTGATSDEHLILTTKTWAVLPGAWVISSQVTTPDGRAASSEPAGHCGTPSASAPGMQRLHRKPPLPADGDLRAREPLLGLPVDRDRGLPRPRPPPDRTLLPADPPRPPRRTRHPPPPRHRPGPRARKVPVTSADPKEPASRRRQPRSQPTQRNNSAPATPRPWPTSRTLTN